ncbi:hypothetical protein ACFOU2_22450 [Bacillus songklensis]|uniref:Uncharacterized protein n=1 Tax=Bacillus songklensis TaxID=1069116 RepID=A0ABV8B855_9BACI
MGVFDTLLNAFVLLGLFAVPLGVSYLVKQMVMVRVCFVFFMLEVLLTCMFTVLGMIEEYAYYMSFFIFSIDIVIFCLAVAAQVYANKVYKKANRSG